MVPVNPIFGYFAAATFLIGIGAGWKVRDWQCHAAYSAALEKAEKQRKELQGKIDAISSEYEAERNQADLVVAGKRSTIREIYKTLPPVALECSPDPRVIGMLESSVSGANSAASGKSGK